MTTTHYLEVYVCEQSRAVRLKWTDAPNLTRFIRVSHVHETDTDVCWWARAQTLAAIASALPAVIQQRFGQALLMCMLALMTLALYHEYRAWRSARRWAVARDRWRKEGEGEWDDTSTPPPDDT